MFRETTAKVFIGKMIDAAITAFDKLMIAATEIIRPNRRIERKKWKKKPASMNYKQL